MKISALPILLIGLAVAVVALSYAFFHEYARNTKQAEYYVAQKEAYDLEAGQLAKAKKRTADAEKMVREREEIWGRIAAARTLPGNPPLGMNLNQNAWQLVVDSRKFRNQVQRALNAQLKRGGVTVLNGPAIPFPDDNAPGILANYFNYPAVPFPVVIYDLGAVTVRGTYSQITANVRSWSTMPNYLAVADGLQITGTSPNLTGTYNLSIVGYLNVSGIYPPVPEGGAPGGGNAPGGGPGGGRAGRGGA